MTEIQMVVVCSIILLILALVVVAMWRDYYQTKDDIRDVQEMAHRYLQFTSSLMRLRHTHGIGNLTNRTLLALYRNSPIHSEKTIDLRVENVLFIIDNNGNVEKLMDEIIECARTLDTFEDYQLQLDAIKTNKKH